MTLDPKDDHVIIYGDGSDEDNNEGYMSADRIVVTDEFVVHISLATGDATEIDTTEI